MAPESSVASADGESETYRLAKMASLITGCGGHHIGWSQGLFWEAFFLYMSRMEQGQGHPPAVLGQFSILLDPRYAAWNSGDWHPPPDVGKRIACLVAKPLLSHLHLPDLIDSGIAWHEFNERPLVELNRSLPFWASECQRLPV